MTEKTTQLLVAGAGYLGLRVANVFEKSGDRVAAVTRSSEKAGHLEQSSISPIVADLANSESPLTLPATEFVLWSVGFDASNSDRGAIWLDGLRRLIRALPAAPKAFVYISSTSVYGTGDGSDVNEDSEIGPQSEGGKCCVAAETLMAEELAARFPDTKQIVLRLAGIYGPNRLLRRVEDLRASKALPGDGGTWLNLIHVDDAVQLIRFVLHSPAPPKLMNVVNTGTVTRHDYYTKLAELTGSPPPRFDGHASGRSRGGNKRVLSGHHSIHNDAGFRFDKVLDAGLPDAVERSDNL